MCHKFMAHPLFSFLRSFFHRISRMNRRHSCLSDYSRIFADIWPLANGWRPKYSLIVFVTQISQMTQIFLRGRVLSHRFHRYTQIFLGTFFVTQISQIYADFYLPIVLPLFLFFFFFFLIPNRSFSPLKSFFMIRPKPWVFRLFLVK